VGERKREREMLELGCKSRRIRFRSTCFFIQCLHLRLRLRSRKLIYAYAAKLKEMDEIPTILHFLSLQTPISRVRSKRLEFSLSFVASLLDLNLKEEGK
jgi:hypothetical protein